MTCWTSCLPFYITSEAASLILYTSPLQICRNCHLIAISGTQYFYFTLFHRQQAIQMMPPNHLHFIYEHTSTHDTSHRAATNWSIPWRPNVKCVWSTCGQKTKGIETNISFMNISVVITMGPAINNNTGLVDSFFWSLIHSFFRLTIKISQFHKMWMC